MNTWPEKRPCCNAVGIVLHSAKAIGSNSLGGLWLATSGLGELQKIIESNHKENKANEGNTYRTSDP